MALVMTSVKSSIVGGLQSTTLKAISDEFKFHKLIRKSSEEMKISPSELGEMEWML